MKAITCPLIERIVIVGRFCRFDKAHQLTRRFFVFYAIIRCRVCVWLFIIYLILYIICVHILDVFGRSQLTMFVTEDSVLKYGYIRIFSNDSMSFKNCLNIIQLCIIKIFFKQSYILFCLYEFQF